MLNSCTLYFKDIPVTAEGIGEYRYDASNQLLSGKLEAGDTQKCAYGPAEGPFDRNDVFHMVVNDGEEHQPTKYEGWGKG